LVGGFLREVVAKGARNSKNLLDRNKYTTMR